MAQLIETVASGYTQQDVTIAPSSSILRLVPGGEEVVVPICKRRHLSRSKDKFVYIDPCFRGNMKNSNEAGLRVSVYEQIQDATLKQMFASLCLDLSKLCMTKLQIVHFLQSRHQWLRTDGYATFFLFVRKREFTVVRVSYCAHNKYKQLFVRGFYDWRVWNSERKHRVVVPKVEPSEDDSSQPLGII